MLADRLVEGLELFGEAIHIDQLCELLLQGLQGEHLEFHRNQFIHQLIKPGIPNQIQLVR